MQIRRPKWWMVVIGIAAVVLGALLSFALWYMLQLRPVSVEQAEQVEVMIEPGMTPDNIGAFLKERELVRSQMAFVIHAKLNGLSGGLQAGMHKLSPSQSIPEIAESLQKAEAQDMVVQLLPGAMLRDNSGKDSSEKQDIRSTLERLGYTREETERGFAADYSSYDATLFQGRPAGASIEGYVYGETYHFEPGVSVEAVLRQSFDELWKRVQEHDLEARFAERGLTLYEGLTLASVIQREVSCQGSQVCDDQKQVAQVFFKRLDEGISLGADATFIYAAAQAGVAPTVDFDSPYNTRIHGGLPPGPISSPGLGALLAVADPAEGDYLFFVSGDDGVNYFARTEAEHVENTRLHCQVNCLLPQN